jgi:serine/threonine-protein kinase
MGPGSSQSGPRSKKEPAGRQPGTFFLGRYRVVDEIGVGGMASVHLARMDGPGGFQKWVAIKRIHPHLVEDDQFVDMFLDEARIAAGINHANVAQVFDLGKDDNTYWIAMEYLHGEPLREVMRRAEDSNQPIQPELAARICAEAAEGLHAAHELRGKNGQLLGLVHRDVTPHNLFVTYEGYTKVVDFGIAKVADRLASTRAGTLKGKLAYMSPEQVRGAEIDRTTDIFALGVVLWELTTNHRLFRMDTDLDTLEKVQACVVPPPSTIVPDYPAELESIVMRALAKRKTDRYQTARELSRALQSFLMHRASFIGPEEVAQYVRRAFGDRIQKREAHLAWAAEVTSTINVDALRAGHASLPGSAEELSLVSYSEADPLLATSQGQAARLPAAGAPPAPVSSRATAIDAPLAPMAATSLMDDDEDIPTAVATRAHVESANRALASTAAARPPPRQGAPQPPPPFQSAPRQPPPQVPRAGPSSSGPAPPPLVPNYAAAPQDERTTALPQGLVPAPAHHDEGFGATLAMPNGPSAEVERARQQAAQHAQHSTMRTLERPAPTQVFPLSFVPAGPPTGHAGAPPHAGRPGEAPYSPSFGPPPGAPSFGPPPGAPAYPRMQSQVDTALSLPRPDTSAALWLAHQDGAQPPRRNSGVLIAVVVLTALCVVGISALVYLKTRGAQATAVAAPDGAAMAATAPPAVPPPAPAPEPAATAPVETAAASAGPTTPPPGPTAEPAAATARPTSAPPPATAPKPASMATASTPSKKEEPGFLTIVCTPFCDDVLDQGRSLGPSPVVRVAVAPGQHRITLKRSGQAPKVISVIVVSGQVTAQRVSMK